MLLRLLLPVWLLMLLGSPLLLLLLHM